jgi:tRNA pseudouridine55 synthase
MMNPSKGGILLLNKDRGRTSFSLVATLRKITGIKKIGHAGTLDPFATGVMVLLIGKEFTRLSSKFLEQDKEYLAKIQLGISTDSFDCDGKQTATSEKIPTREEVDEALKKFQGTISQLPPMFSAKKKNGKKLYELARAGKEVEREPVEVTLHTQLLHYEYPYLELRISCSKGTYIRSIANDLGNLLGSGGHLKELVRMRSGPFHLKDCIDQSSLSEPGFNIWPSILNHLPLEKCSS